MHKKFIVLFISGLITSSVAINVVSTATDAELTAAYLAESLVGNNVSVFNASMNADPRGIGRYTNGKEEAQGNKQLKQGIVFGTGFVEKLNTGINTSDNTTSTFPRLGDADLTALLPSTGSGTKITRDATILEFDFFTIGEGQMDASFQYLFGSDEYDEYAGTKYNDVFGFFLDGRNIATIPGTSIPVTINNINLSANSSLYHSNDPTNGVPTPYATEMDGFTVPLTAEFTVAGGSTHHLKIAIADAEDFRWDSWVFIGEGSFTARNAVAVPEAPVAGLLIAGLLLLTSARLLCRKPV